MQNLKVGDEFQGYLIVSEINRQFEPSSRTRSFIADSPDSIRVYLTFFDTEHNKLQNVVKVKGLKKSVEQFCKRGLWEKEENIDHPNIARLYDVLTDADSNQYCIVREYISDLLFFEATKGLAPTDMIPLFKGVLEALYYLHAEKKVLHLNIKSKKVRVRMKDNGQYEVKLIDCGYAIPIEEAKKNGVKSGTPSSMSPEVIMGNKELIGPASDLYSFGCLMYYCLTSRIALIGRLAAGTNLKRLAEIVKSEHMPLPPSAINSQCPESLDVVVMNLLRPNPEERLYSSAKDVIKDLDKVVPEIVEDSVQDDEISLA